MEQLVSCMACPSISFPSTVGESCSWLRMVQRNGVKAEHPRWAQLACTPPWGAEAGVHLSGKASGIPRGVAAAALAQPWPGLRSRWRD